MKTLLRNTFTIFQAGSIGQFIFLLLGTVLLLFLLFGAAAWYNHLELIKLADRYQADAVALVLVRNLEVAVLAERRELRLWDRNRDPAHLEERLRWLTEEDLVMEELGEHVTTAEEARVFIDIQTIYEKYRGIREPGDALSEPTTGLVNRFLQSLESYRIINENQIDETLQTRHEKEEILPQAAAAILIPLFVVLSVAALALWNRIAVPIFSLRRATQEFGAGKLETRAAVFRRDEIGALCESFNAMAEEIRNRERDRLAFLATVAHDIRNPLAVLKGAISMLSSDQFPEGKRTEWYKRMNVQVEKLIQMTSDFMDTAQAGTGTLSLNVSTFDLAEFIKACVCEAEDAHPKRRISFESAGSSFVDADQDRLDRVVANLISNAVKYSDSETEIVVEVGCERSFGRISVVDQGVGMTDEEIETLFRPFARLKKTSETTVGTGLGLFSIKQIIEAHDGRIEICSKPGHGSRVSVYIPTTE